MEDINQDKVLVQFVEEYTSSAVNEMNRMIKKGWFIKSIIHQNKSLAGQYSDANWGKIIVLYEKYTDDKN